MEYNKTDKRILLIIPAFNEEKNLEKLIEGIKTAYPQYDYLIINDDSSDETRKLCLRNGYEHVNHFINLGIGGAVQTGYLYALENGYDIAVQVDGDGQHDIRYVEKLIQPIIEDRADVVIGSRFIENEGFQSNLARRMGIRILSCFIRVLCNTKIKDVTSGFRAVNRRMIGVYARDYAQDYPEPEAIIIAKMYKARIEEVPVVMKERESGKSSINLWRSIYYMIKVTLALLITRISYGVRR